MNRQSGILLPIFSLPGKYGIGCFSKEAYSFADFLKRTGQQCWQILPLGPTGYGDSPYQSFSTFAGNPYFISLEMLMTDSLLTEEECCELSVPGTERCVDYGLLYNRKIALLKKACARCEYDRDPAFIAFCEKNAYWLDDYSLFMALKEEHDGRPFDQWEPALAAHEESAVAQAAKRLQQEMAFYRFVQFEFDREWKKLREYVNSLGIRIIGDIPIYVSADSADFWAHRDLFMLDETASSGATRCTTGRITKRPVTTGGKGVSENVWNFTTSSGSTISAVSMNSLLFRQRTAQQRTGTGKKGRGWIFSRHLSSHSGN